jgi:hypothetical protein
MRFSWAQKSNGTHNVGEEPGSKLRCGILGYPLGKFHTVQILHLLVALRMPVRERIRQRLEPPPCRHRIRPFFGAYLRNLAFMKSLKETVEFMAFAVEHQDRFSEVRRGKTLQVILV